MKLKFVLLISSIIFVAHQGAYAVAKDYLPGVTKEKVSAQIKAFSQKLADEHGFDSSTIESQLEKLEPRQDIIARITKPAESMPWYRYRKIFIQDKRIDAGVGFWKKHQETLEKAEQQFGVDASIIVAIIGVETFFGKIQGDFPVIEALHTLGFYYPKRAKFFRSELEQYYLLAREQNWQLSNTKGSYAGAMGMGQFISSSYRHYGYDFNNDGKVNLFNDPVDMIGSVANYFNKHQWKKSQFVAEKVVPSIDIKNLKQTELKLQHDYSSIEKAGATLSELASSSNRFGVFEFEKKAGEMDYWVVGDNFYSITRYNRSPLYALAVYQLSEAIASKMQNQMLVSDTKTKG